MKKLTIKGVETSYSIQEFKAMYCYEVGRNIVIYNKKLRGRLRLVVILHELGHKLLHWRIIGSLQNLVGTNKDSLRNPESDDEEKASDHSQGSFLFLCFHHDECMLCGMYV